jgi:hypothetical protein
LTIKVRYDTLSFSLFGYFQIPNKYSSTIKENTMLTFIHLGSGRRLQDGVIISNPSVINSKIQSISIITRAVYNKKGTLVQRAKYPILRQTLQERNRSNYHMASLTGLKSSDLYLVEKAHIDNWVAGIEETKTSQLNTEIELVVDGQIVTGTLIEFHNQAPVEGMLTNLLKGRFRSLLKMQQANSGAEFEEMLQELYCGQTQGTVWGWLNIIQTLDTETNSNAQQMTYIQTEFERKLINRLDRRYFKHYFAEQSISDAEMRLRDDEGKSSLFDLVSESWYGDAVHDEDFDAKLQALKASMPEDKQRALEAWLAYVPDDKVFGEDIDGVPVCIKRRDVAGWDLPVNFIDLCVDDAVEFQYQDGRIVKMMITRTAFDTTRQLFKIAGLSNTTALEAFGLSKEYLEDIAKVVKPTKETLISPDISTTNIGSRTNYAVVTFDQPRLTDYELQILDLASYADAEFLNAVTKLARKRYESHVVVQYDDAAGCYIMQHNDKCGVKFTKPEALLRMAIGK